MRISDWSSDVCSSDLRGAHRRRDRAAHRGWCPAAPGRSAGGVPAPGRAAARPAPSGERSEEHTSELQSLMRISYADFCLKKKNYPQYYDHTPPSHTHSKITHTHI